MSKYSILIVDDEEMICRSVQSRLSRLELENAGEILWTDQPKTVPEILTSRTIDVLIIDIRMPQISGLDLIKGIQKKYPRIRTIILSGYESFDYAKTALQYNVREYLLKPVNTIKMKDAVERVFWELNEEDRKNAWSKNLEIENILFAAVQDETSAADWVERFAAVTQNRPYTLLLTSVKNTRYKNLSSEIKTLTSFRDPAGRTGFILPFADQLQIETEILAGKIYRRLNKDIGETVFLSTVEPADEARMLPEMYFQCRNILIYQQLLGRQPVMHLKQYAALKNPDLEQSELQMLTMLKEIDEKDDLLPVLKEMFSRCRLRNYKLEYVSMLYRKVTGIILPNETVPDFHSFSSLDEMITLLVDRYSHSKEKFRETVALMIMAENYIKKNFNSPIVMNDVADHLGLSYYHFGKRFKAHTGKNFLEYLTGIRMKKAEEYLSDPRINVKDAAVYVGYTNPKTFLRVFKQYYNMTPSRFRDEAVNK